MLLSELVSILNKNRITLFHFTDTRNLPSIAEHGLLSLRKIHERSLQDVAFGGNDWSHEADERVGLDSYVHLCFRNRHPMEYRAKNDRRIEESKFIKVNPDVLLFPDVKFCLDVSNKKGVSCIDPEAFIEMADLKVLYTRTDWSDPVIQGRLRAAEKYEALVPSSISADYLEL